MPYYKRLALLAMASGVAVPALIAQSTSFDLTPSTPNVFAQDGGGNNGRFTVAPGAVTFSLSAGATTGTGTVSIQGPAQISGIDAGTRFYPADSASSSVTIRQTLSGFKASSVSLSTGPGLNDQCPVTGTGTTCTLQYFEKGKDIDGNDVVSVTALVTLRVDSNLSPPAFIIVFLWRLGNSCPASVASSKDRSAVAGPTCAVNVSRLEAVQVTQSFPGDSHYYPIPLIAGKTTTIRMYPIQSNPQAEVGGMISISNADGPPETLEPHYTVMPRTSVFRDKLDIGRASVDFRIPGDMTKNGDLTITGKFVDPGNGAPLPKDPAPITLHFQPQAKPLAIRYMEWCWKDDSTPAPICPSDQADHAGDMADGIWFLRATYPTADDGVTYVPLWLPPQTWSGEMRTTEGLQKFINRLRRWYIVLRGFLGADQDQLLGWMPYIASWGAGGEADAPAYGLYPATTPIGSVGHVAWVADLGVSPILEAAYAEVSVAHEIGHNLGLRHPALTSDWGGAGRDEKSCFPYSSSIGQNAGYFSDGTRQQVVPSTAWDFMSYHTYQQNWLAPFTYDVLVRGQLLPQLDTINRDWDPAQSKCVASPGTAAPPAVSLEIKSTVSPSAATGEIMIVSGTVAQDGTAHIDPGYRLATGNVIDSSDPAGAFCINFGGTAGSGSAFCFNLSFNTPEAGTLKSQAFTFAVPFPAQATSISLTKQGTPIASVPVSKNPPAIAITSPHAGDAWNGGSQTITWTASDPDGDPLTYIVLYSADGGSTYTPLALDLTDSQFTLDPSMIRGGSQVYIQVVASDGVNTAAATAGPLSINQTPKLVAAAPSFVIGNASARSVATSTVTLKSAGSGPVVVSSATIDNPAFTIAGPPMPLMIPAGRQASLVVEFAPSGSARGAQPGTITITSDDSASPLIVPISGNAFTEATPNAVVVPQSLSFVASAGQKQDLRVLVANSGSANLAITSISSSNASFTTVGAQNSYDVPANGSQAITVRFTAPASAIAQTGTLTVVTNDPTNGTRATPLSGIVSAPVAPPSGGAVCVPPPPNLVTWLTGDGNANDALGNNNGLPQGSVSYGAGQVGQAFQFDGATGYVSLGNPASLSLTSSISIEAWIYPRSAPAVNNLKAVVAKWAQIFNDQADADSYGLWITQEANGLKLFAAIHQSGGKEPHVVGGSIPLNAWTHVAMTFDSASGHLTAYVNGQAVDSLTSTGPIYPTNRRVLVGREDSFIPRYFDGLIDEASVYSRGLSASEIQAIVGAAGSGKCKPTGSGGGGRPQLQFSGSAIDASGTLNFTQAGSLQVTVKNVGTVAATIGSIQSSNAAFSASPQSLIVAAGGMSAVMVTYAPTASSGAVQGTLTFSLAGGETASLKVAGSGAGSGGGGSTLQFSGTVIDSSGTVNFTQAGIALVTAKNTGTAPVTVSSIQSSNAAFSASPQSFTVTGGGTATVSVTFSPTAGTTGTQQAKLIFNFSGGGTVSLNVTGSSGGGGGAQTVQLAVDGGSYGATLGYPAGVSQAYFVNRLTPPSYPATLRSVQIAIANRTDSFALGDPLTVLTAANPSGSESINGISFIRTSSAVTALGQINSYNVSPLTIESGDFVVGFSAVEPPGKYLVQEDLASGSKQRSYLSPDGKNFSLTDSFQGLAGNWGIRATVDLGGSGGGTGCVTPPAKLVSWWRGEGNSSDSVGGNTGRLEGGASFGTGEVGQAFQFDGATGDVSMGDPASLRLTTGMTIEGWVKARSLKVQTAGPPMGAILTKWAQVFPDTPDSDSYGLWLIQNGASVNLFSAIHQPSAQEPHLQGGTIPLNTWTHVAATFESGGQYLLYVNGQQVASGSFPGTIFPTSHSVLIGRESSYIGRAFDGWIDEMSVYSRALTAAELQAILAAGTAGKCSSGGGGRLGKPE